MINRPRLKGKIQRVSSSLREDVRVQQLRSHCNCIVSTVSESNHFTPISMAVMCIFMEVPQKVKQLYIQQFHS